MTKKTYTIIINPQGYTKRKAIITEEGAKIIWAVYEKLYGKSQSMDTRESRGCIAYTSEIYMWQLQGHLPIDFDWMDYRLD